MSDQVNVTPYIGLPYADHGREGGFDCWGLIRLVLQRERNILMPDYGDGYVSASDMESVATTIRDGLLSDWVRVPGPEVFALVVFNIAAKPWHVGLVVGPDRFLHMPAKETSCVERLSSLAWLNRIEGFYVSR